MKIFPCTLMFHKIFRTVFRCSFLPKRIRAVGKRGKNTTICNDSDRRNPFQRRSLLYSLCIGKRKRGQSGICKSSIFLAACRAVPQLCRAGYLPCFRWAEQSVCFGGGRTAIDRLCPKDDFSYRFQRNETLSLKDDS